MSEKKQFDEYLGGTEKLPNTVHIMGLASARATEIAAMTESLENPQQTKLIFQKLPVHMRRRVMSHNAKRMPRKLRIGHLSQMTKSGLPPKNNRHSRKYRRRPHNLLNEYNRRQKNKFWLETHIWHAKRFKMVEKWGFKLALHSNDRNFRANYRAMTNHCLIQDISYYTCIEITGPLESLKQNLKLHCNPNELTFAAKAYINGEREGTLMFYKKDGYPFSPIGYVDFLWKASDSNIKSIWIWVHPAFYNDVLQEIIKNFNFQLQKNSNTCQEEIDKIEDINTNPNAKVESSKLRIFHTTKVPVYTSSDGCQLSILRNCLNRFRLSGPLTISILADAIKLPLMNSKFILSSKKKIISELDENSSEKMDCQDNQNLPKNENDDSFQYPIDQWFNSYYRSKDNLEILKIQKNVFRNLGSLKTPNQLPPNMVLALTVLDPRFFLPEKRIKSVSNSQIIEEIPMPPSLANRSPLWDLNVRQYVTKNCVSTIAINNLRSECLVPGVQNDQFYDENIIHKIPILLIQKPGNYGFSNSIGLGSGIDIVLPAGWSMPFWLALILRCAKPGGLRESKSTAYENSNLNNAAINHPDTDAYNVEANCVGKALCEKYFKRPPNKRVNYKKLAITSPFFCEWQLLMREWNKVETFYILRDRKILSILYNKMYANLGKKRKTAPHKMDENNLSIDLEDFIENKNSFVPIKLTSQSKGVPKDFSIICLPTKEDMLRYNNDKNWSGPVQSVKKTNINISEMCKKYRELYLQKLRRLKRQRQKIKRVPKLFTSKIKFKETLCESQKIIEQKTMTMEKLYLPDCTSVRHSCDREVIGYITEGGFSFKEAKGIGLGYVILSSILHLINEKSSIVLIRNTTSRKFRICKLEILH